MLTSNLNRFRRLNIFSSPILSSGRNAFPPKIIKSVRNNQLKKSGRAGGAGTASGTWKI
jgi:hypothetical protein